ncbi:glycosyltransferase family 4 protein [Rhizosaccharibacter radicis]|uniref:Glycosyltransferase family 4 protein n=1 Tax=Rhizosaccharibacter radicis TaxID=2782605 RepID=A0ABT1VXA0_9PROT|nr:glycosyltransferase family 4 protein [Acetobacteraceae bacterium KSS12]
MSEARLWFDAEDLFHFGRHGGRPSGIQRVCFEIYAALMDDPVLAGRVGFLRHAPNAGPHGSGFVEAGWAEIRQIIDRATAARDDAALPGSPGAAMRAADGDAAGHPRGVAGYGRRAAKRALGVVPDHVRRPAQLFAVMQVQAAAALAGAATRTAAMGAARAHRSLGTVVRSRVDPSSRLGARAAALWPEDGLEPEPLPLEAVARRGDVLVVLGSPWFESDYARRAAFLRGRLGLRLAVLVYDAIPALRPEWTSRGMVRAYRGWYGSVLPLADRIFAISRATADDLGRWCRRDNIVLRAPVELLPLGTGFGPEQPGKAGDAAAGGNGEAAAESLPPVLARRLEGRPFVLFVSTIEARKNHLLLFRAWRRLLEEMPPTDVPDLVFAGSVGWLVADLMAQIENSRFLGGRLHVLEGLGDEALRSLYRGCLFTIFPSFHEGWGLPVAESFAMGKPCLASNATALPEAGGELARYFDPTDLHDTVRAIRAVLEDREGLRNWEAEVRRSFQPSSWHRTARTLVERILAPG